MMTVEFDKCLDVSTLFREYKETTRLKNLRCAQDKPSIFVTSAGSFQESFVLLKNKTYIFHYFLRNKVESFYKDVIGTVNKNPVRFCGIYVPEKQALLVDMSHKIVSGFTKDKNKIDCTRVDLEIEVQLEKPLAETSSFDMDYYFIDSKGKRRRIQFSSEPEIYTNDKTTYPNAEEVYKGYGFYSELHPELNVNEPVFLDGKGSILHYNEAPPLYITKNDCREESWDNLSIPAV